MKFSVHRIVYLFWVFTAVVARAQVVPMVVYDSFDGNLIDPAKWLGQEFPGCCSAREAVREIRHNEARLAIRIYGDTGSNSGTRGAINRLRHTNPAAVTAMEADLTVSEIDLMGCLGNPAPGSVRFTLEGFFFNTSVPVTGSHANDVTAGIRVFRRSNSTDPPKVLTVEAFFFHCLNDPCSSIGTSVSQTLGAVTQGKKTRIRVRWDAANDRFAFVLDENPEVFLNYILSDISAPGNDSKIMDVTNFAQNCTVATLPSAFMEVLLDEVRVNP